MSACRAFNSAANSLARPRLTQIRLAPSALSSAPTRLHLRPRLAAQQLQLQHQYAATLFPQTRGYASISTKTSTGPSSFDAAANLSPGARAVITVTRGVRNLLIIATSTLGLGLFVFMGAHSYLEQYKCPSPPGVSTEVQRCLHGAWVREEISSDPDIAEVYYQKALEFLRKDLEKHYANKNKDQNSNEQLVYLEIEKDTALAEIQNRFARFYARIGQDEQAATLWTRLWKLSEKQYSRSSVSSSSSGLGSLFGASADRPLISQKDAIPYARAAADCWMRMGEYELAEEALGWCLSTLTSDSNSPQSLSPQAHIEEIGLLSTLGALYVRQRKFDYALSLFVKALELVQNHRATQPDSRADEKTLAAFKEESDMWFCREAILTQSIGETLYGAANAAHSLSSTTSTSTSSSTPSTTEPKKSSWKFWSSSTSSSSSSSPSTATTVSLPQKSPELIKKEEEALGWIQKALSMAKSKSGQHRDCDECAALGLNILGLINEIEGKKDVALTQFKEAVLHATMAKDYVGIDNYNHNIARLTDQIQSESEDTTPIPA
ncbi:hypothetical protein FBU30_006775 [Linnemannia zychae]|nr:hypothetical protein FBU30_006775 [Linnemannia zychae]